MSASEEQLNTGNLKAAKLAILLGRKLDSVARVVLLGSMGFLVFMMLLMTADVVGRYFANRPIGGSWELIGFLLVCLAASGLAYTQREKGNIRVLVLFDRLPQRGKTIVDILSYLIAIGVVSVMSWRLFVMAKRYILLPQGGLSEDLHIPFAIFMIILGIGLAFLGLVLLVDLIYSLSKVTEE